MGVNEREEGKEKRKCEARVIQGNESDEQKVDQDVMSEVRDELTDATNLTENPEELEELGLR